MQQSATLSTSNAILPQQERTAPSGHWPSGHGVKSSLRREPGVPGEVTCSFGHVTEHKRTLFCNTDPAIGQVVDAVSETTCLRIVAGHDNGFSALFREGMQHGDCLLYTSDAADE